MTVTARLSQKFYETFGDEPTNELVGWMNQVDAALRLNLRELNDTNFLRFEARLDERFATWDLKLEKRFAELDAKWEKRFAELDMKWEKRFAELDMKWEKRLVDLDAKWEVRLAQLETRLMDRIESLHSSQLRWTLTAWVTLLAAVVALMKLA